MEIYSHSKRSNNLMHIALLLFCITALSLSTLYIYFRGNNFIASFLLAVGGWGLIPTVYGIVKPKTSSFFYIDEHIMFWFDNTLNTPVLIEYTNDLKTIEVLHGIEDVTVLFKKHNGGKFKISPELFSTLEDFIGAIENSKLSVLLNNKDKN